MVGPAPVSTDYTDLNAYFPFPFSLIRVYIYIYICSYMCQTFSVNLLSQSLNSKTWSKALYELYRRQWWSSVQWKFLCYSHSCWDLSSPWLPQLMLLMTVDLSSSMASESSSYLLPFTTLAVFLRWDLNFSMFILQFTNGVSILYMGFIFFMFIQQFSTWGLTFSCSFNNFLSGF